MKTKSVTQLKKLADAAFSQYIRLRDQGRCYTCTKQDEPKYMQCGHFVSRSYNYYRYDEKNCHAQCVGCNVFKHGNMVTYAVRFVSDYGVETLREFEHNRFKERRFTPKELLELIEKYKRKIENYAQSTLHNP
jgi:hypothetical protein